MPADLDSCTPCRVADDDWPAAITLMSELRVSSGDDAGFKLAGDAALFADSVAVVVGGLRDSRGMFPVDALADGSTLRLVPVYAAMSDGLLASVFKPSDPAGGAWVLPGTSLSSDLNGSADEAVAGMCAWLSVFVSKIVGFSECGVSSEDGSVSLALAEDDCKDASVLVDCGSIPNGSTRTEDGRSGPELVLVIEVCVVAGSLM